MAERRKRLFRRLFGGIILILVAAAGAGGLKAGGWFDRPGPLDHLRRVPARRMDLHLTVNAPGEIQSAKKTKIECELENLSISAGGGNQLASNGSSTIIELIEDGAQVRSGDVLCLLDSSEYVEMVRQQEIKVQQANAELQKAKLDLKASEIALLEFTQGLLSQQRESFEEQQILHEADIRRLEDRILWSESMVANGYLSEDKLQREKEALLRSRINLDGTLMRLDNLEKYTGPIQAKRLEAAVERAREEVSYQQIRLMRREEQLEQFRLQVERCTIRAPHDGMVIYANDRDDDPRIQLGATVRKRMDLFFLPDMGDMEVLTVLHESIVEKVKLGQSALVRVEAFSKQLVEGQVTSVSPMPLMVRGRGASDEVKNFLARVRLHSVPQGLTPGMTAEVEIVTAHVPEALVVPVTAVTIRDGRGFLYVADDDDRLERREVRFSPGTLDYLRVTEGLEEGEEIIADCTQLQPEEVLAAVESEPLSEPSLPLEPADSAVVATSDHLPEHLEPPSETTAYATQ